MTTEQLIKKWPLSGNGWREGREHNVTNIS